MKSSLRSKIFKKILYLRKKSNKIESPDEWKEYFNEKRRINSEPYKLPNFNYKSTINYYEMEDMPIYILEPPQMDNDKVIIHLHGGGFISKSNNRNWKFLDRLAVETQQKIIVPLYPLLPDHNFKQAYDKLKKFYTIQLEKHDNENISFCGYSAGGCLSLGLSLYLKENNIPIPKNIILISPWLDLRLGNPEIDELEDKDPLLYKDYLKTLAISWADGEKLDDYRLSPINGNIMDLENISIFVGTHDILYPDTKIFYNKCKSIGKKINYFVFEGLYHNFIALPIHEINKTLQLIVEVLK